MPVAVCPTVTAYDTHEYREQMERIAPFAERVHIDLMDGHFAPTTSPGLEHVWWPRTAVADLHLMYQHPMLYVPAIIRLKPSLAIIHAEAEADHALFADNMRAAGIRPGLALLSDTPTDKAADYIDKFDHVLIFSGHLGYHGGQADLSLLDKVKEIRRMKPEAEIGWDGGVTDQNAKQLADAGVHVLNVGGFIQRADDPAAIYNRIKDNFS